jgi:hypothetical protein
MLNYQRVVFSEDEQLVLIPHIDQWQQPVKNSGSNRPKKAGFFWHKKPTSWSWFPLCWVLTNHGFPVNICKQILTFKETNMGNDNLPIA